MTWIKLEDDFPHHPDVWALPPESAWLFVSALCYSRHHLTDGFIKSELLELVCRGAKPKHVLPLLGTRWDQVEGGWQIRNYERYQQTKAEVERSREAGANRAKRSRERKRDMAARPSTEVEEEIDNPPKSPQGDVVCIRCQGDGVVETGELTGIFEDCDCKLPKRRTG